MTEWLEGKRLVVVSNRLPVAISRNEETGEWRARASSGGLVTAMAPILNRRGGLWIGWPGLAREDEPEELGDLLARVADDAGHDMVPVSLTRQEQEDFYLGFSNQVAWPLFHDLLTLYNFDPAYWRTYRRVNRKYAECIAAQAGADDYVWVHDYHLMMVARELRDMGFEGKVGFFLHTPFPTRDIYLKLPWRFEILEGLLDYDLIGFQTIRDRRHFLGCVRELLADVPVRGAGPVVTGRVEGREIRVGAFPIAMDFKEFERLASEPSVAETCESLRRHLPGRKFILGVDRLDYTKGIPYRLEAFRRALRTYDEFRYEYSLIQVVVPSRENIAEYNELKDEIERLVGNINGEFTESGYVPIHYIYRSLPRRELLARYRSADIALVTPLKDGMNLVAKEYCACNVGGEGVLILSEFAGAADQLQSGALLVNPFDIEGMAAALYRAATMPVEERRERMTSLREVVRRQDIFWWVDLFMRAAAEESLEDFPRLQVYSPRS